MKQAETTSMSGQGATDFAKLVDDARTALLKAAADARMTGLVSSLKPNIHGNPSTLDEVNAFAHGVSTAVLAIGFLRPEVREAYHEVLHAAIDLSRCVWQAKRSLRVVVERDEVVPGVTG